jgi:AcrR family transcriptional regulator
MTTSLPSGLRERKKARTRAAIRAHAMRLFREQGYAATTVDQIAEAAEVSQSTFFRYFPTKEDVVLTDDYDPLIVAAVRAQPPEVSPIAAIRNGIHEVYETITDEDWERERERQRIMQDAPELRARAMQQILDVIRLIGEAVADRAGLPADDFTARVLSGAVLGAALSALPGGVTGLYDRVDLVHVDRALDLLEAGLPLDGSRGRP